jgi:hypothetical protein
VPSNARVEWQYGTPATEKQIAAAEAEIGVPFPKSLRALYSDFDGLLWEGNTTSVRKGDNLDLYVFLPLSQLRKARDVVDAIDHYKTEFPGWSKQFRRCVVFSIPESGASFHFMTDKSAWGIAKGHVGKWDHDGGVHELAASLEEYLEEIGRAWRTPGWHPPKMYRQIAALLRLFRGQVPDRQTNAWVTKFATSRDRWPKSLDLAARIRDRLLRAANEGPYHAHAAEKDPVKVLQYGFEELCIKTLHNETDTSMRYDSCSPYWIVGSAIQLARAVNIPVEKVLAVVAPAEEPIAAV